MEYSHQQLNKTADMIRQSILRIDGLKAGIDAELIRISELIQTVSIDLEYLNEVLPRFLSTLRFSGDSAYEYGQACWDLKAGSNLRDTILTRIEDGFELYGIKAKGGNESYDMLIFRKKKQL